MTTIYSSDQRVRRVLQGERGGLVCPEGGVRTDAYPEDGYLLTIAQRGVETTLYVRDSELSKARDVARADAPAPGMLRYGLQPPAAITAQLDRLSTQYGDAAVLDAWVDHRIIVQGGGIAAATLLWEGHEIEVPPLAWEDA